MDEFFSKTVVLLKKDDCERRDGNVFMPTTIEMAKIKKPNTGQYRTNVQFSPRMSEEMVRQKIRETFPTFDLNGRFSCAAVSQDSITFQFHGDPRIWDGSTIKSTIRGHSVLYIVMDEDQMDTSGISGSDPEPTQDADQSLVQWLNDNLDFEVGMRPSESPLQGGNPFCATFRPNLHAQVTAGRAIFLMPNNDLETVQLTRVNGELFGSRFPAAREPGWATVKIESQDGIRLGETKIYYYPDGRHVVVMVRNPSIFEKVCLDMSHNLVGSSNSSDGRPQNSGALGFKQQVLLLCLLVYTAAKEGAKQFIELIFASSAGRMVFDAYRESSPLPEVIAKEHGNEGTARYLEDVTKRFSEEKTTGGEHSQKIDWLELARAAKEASKQPGSSECPEATNQASNVGLDAESKEHLVQNRFVPACASFVTFEDHTTDEKDTSQLESDLFKERGYSADAAKEAAKQLEIASEQSCQHESEVTKETGYFGDGETSPSDLSDVQSSDSEVDTTASFKKDFCDDYSGTSTSATSTALSPSIASSYMAPSGLPIVPSTTEYPGELGFQISFGPPTESASKSATWTYSDVCKKLYVKLASFCPIKFKTSMQPPPGTYLRAVAVFKGFDNWRDVVKRCHKHMESSNDGSAPNNHFIRSNNRAARYYTCPESGRHSVILPYKDLQMGTEYITEMFAFMCFSSCASGPSRRPVEVIFTLERDGQTLGRRVVEIRVCACPGRERNTDENVFSSSQRDRRKRRGPGNKGQASKRRRISSTSEDEEFVSSVSRTIK